MTLPLIARIRRRLTRQWHLTVLVLVPDDGQPLQMRPDGLAPLMLTSLEALTRMAVAGTDTLPASLQLKSVNVFGYEPTRQRFRPLQGTPAAAEAAAPMTSLMALARRIGRRSLLSRHRQQVLFTSAVYLLDGTRELEKLMRQASEHGIAEAASPAGEILAVAASPTGLAMWRRPLADRLQTLVSRLRTTPPISATAIPCITVHNLQAIGVAGITGAALNTALAEVLLQAPRQLADEAKSPAKTDPPQPTLEQLRDALITRRDSSSVSWVFNTWLNHVEHSMGHPLPASIPPEVHLALNARCNIECSFCSYHHRMARADQVSLKQIMALDFLSDVRIMRLHSGNGESTLNPELPAIIDYLSATYPHLSLNFFTNGIQLDRPRLIPALVGSSVNWISVSINAASAATWQKLCGANLFDRVVSNLKRLMLEKRRRKCATPIVYGSMVLTRDSVQEMPLMPALCRRLGIDRFTAIPFFSLGYEYQDRLGPADAYHHIGAAYDSIYDRTLAEAKHHGVSLECPSPSHRKSAQFGLEQREFHDFANIGSGGDLRIEQLLGPLHGAASIPCAYLWRQAAIGIADRQGSSASSGHFLYPCLGPLVSLKLAQHLPFVFGSRKDFEMLWRNELMTKLRQAQRYPGQIPVCDACRNCDSRSPDQAPAIETLLRHFRETHLESGDDLTADANNSESD
jgi:hypothetical protein